MPADRVLTEMQSLGLGATEFGPDGFLPTDPAEKAAFLEGYGLQAVGGFLPAWSASKKGVIEAMRDL
jgi:inosose dehydratase